MANRKSDKLFILSYYVGHKVETVEVWGYSVTITNGLYCLLDSEGYIAFEILKDNFISAIRKEALDEQRKASKSFVLAR